MQTHFPELRIVARARDIDRYIRLRKAGVETPERETFEAALKVGRMALEGLGLGRYEARERADLFRRFNTQMVEKWPWSITLRSPEPRSLNAPARC